MKKVTIYQIDRNACNDAHYKCFSSFDDLKRFGLEFNPNDYKVVYDGELDVENTEDVYRVLNIGMKPNGYKGHSLSVSDLVEMDGKVSYCDSFGFKDVTTLFIK